MEANFRISQGEFKPFDKCILLFNFDGLNEVYLQGFAYSKKKIKKAKNLVGVWKIKNKK